MSYFSRPHGGHYEDLSDAEYWQTRSISVDGCRNYIVTMGADYWDWLDVLSHDEGETLENFYRAAIRALFRAGVSPNERGSGISVSLAYQVELGFQRHRKRALGYINDDFWGDTIIIRTGGDPAGYYGIPPRAPCLRETCERPVMPYCGYDLNAAILNVGCRNLAAPANDRPI